MAALARMATGTHKQIKIKEDDTVIFSSKFIPGNEKAITRIINNLYRRGADVIYEKISEIHVSGHAFQEELKLMINLTRPKYFIPIHGEYRHLILHSRLAEQVGISKENILLAENGQIIEFNENGGRIQDRVVTGRVLIDAKELEMLGGVYSKRGVICQKTDLLWLTWRLMRRQELLSSDPRSFQKGLSSKRRQDICWKMQSVSYLKSLKKQVLKFRTESKEFEQRYKLH